MHTNSSPNTRRAFTLVELMVSTAILGLLLIVLVQMTNQTSKTWHYTTGKIEQFREARMAFETMTRRIGQATLNTYWGYQYNDPNPSNATRFPTAFVRQSELAFVSGSMQGGVQPLAAGGGALRPTHGIFFQAPLGFVASSTVANSTTYNDLHGLDNLLNTWGYYVELNDDVQSGQRPPIFTTSTPPLRVRSRLMELMQSADQVTIYSSTLPAVNNPTLLTAASTDFSWFTKPLVSSGSINSFHVLAENIVALIILPKLSKQDQTNYSITDSSLAPNYYYNSETAGPGSGGSTYLNTKNQLPPVVQVTMVAIDETSASRLLSNATSAASFVSLLQLNTHFTDASKYQTDLEQNPTSGGADPNSLEQTLINNQISYRIFSTNVSIRGAKWSQAQTK